MKTVDQLVRATLADMQLPMHYYVQFLHYALDFIQTDLELDSFGNVTRTGLTLDSSRQADLPADFDQVVNVAFANGNYMIYIPKRDTLKDLGATDSATDRTVYIPFTNYYFDNVVNTYGEHMGKHYGLAAGNGQWYGIDNDKIILGHDFQEDDTIYLEYLSTSRYTTASVVDSNFHRAVKSYIVREFTNWNRRANQADKARADKRFKNEFRKARARIFGLSKEEWLQIIRVNTRQGIKG